MADILPTIGLCCDSELSLLDPRLPDRAAQGGRLAHALSHLCRFNGHTRTFYSVAQHSVLVSRLVPPEHALAALLHDGSEAFLGDVASPLKALLPDYRALEATMQARVLEAFGLPASLPECVHVADRMALCIEARSLLPGYVAARIADSVPLPGPLPDTRVEPLSPAFAREAFKARLSELTGVG